VALAKSMNLPQFDRPPLEEVAIGMQFAPLPLRLVDVGAFHASLAEEYPNSVDVPPLGAAFETFASGQFPATPFPLMINAPWRCWILSKANEYIIQLQPDRLLANWRARPEGVPYPRFAEIKRRFFQAASKLESFIRDESGLYSRINQCEVTYFNKIAIPEGTEFCNLETVLEGAGVLGGRSKAEIFTEGMVSFSRILKDESGSPFARLRVELGSGFDARSGKVWVLNLTVRGRPPAGMSPIPEDFFDRAHVEIVNAFADITNREMQEKWGRVR
jgi:uncharacterized protein (TIGR04255 family)